MRPRSTVPSFLLFLAALLAACGGAGGGGQLALVGVTVIDGLGNPPAPGRAVVIRDGRIAEVVAAEGFDAPRGVKAIRLPGRTVMPGLVDLDAHVTVLPAGGDGALAAEIDRRDSERVLKTLLAFGITTVRDPAAAAENVALRDAVASGEILGPRISTAGNPLGLTAIAHGAPWSAEALPGGKRADEQKDLRDRIAWLETVDLEGPEIGEKIALLADRRIPVDPTLIAYHAKFFGDEERHRKNPELHLAPESIRALWERSTLVDDWTGDEFARAKAAWPKLLELTKKLFDGGVLLAAGSGLPSPWVIPGVSLHQELRLLHDAGIPPIEVLKIATMNGALALGLDGEIGSVEPGKVADLVVLAADPTASLMNTRAISHVFRGGRFLDPAALLE